MGARSFPMGARSFLMGAGSFPMGAATFLMGKMIFPAIQPSSIDGARGSDRRTQIELTADRQFHRTPVARHLECLGCGPLEP